MPFEEATRVKLKLRMAIAGPSGSGKTATSLLFATTLARHCGGRVAVLDSEHGRSLAYVNTPFAPDGFKHQLLGKNASVDNYRNCIKQAAMSEDIKVLVIDSISHAWAGDGGLLEVASDGGDDWKKWGDIGKAQNKLITDIISSPFHVIVTLRTKTEYVIQQREPDAKGKKKIDIDRVGTIPVQRKGFEYEFGIFASMDLYHNITITKTDCSSIDRIEVATPGADFMVPIIEWLETGASVTAPEVRTTLCRLDQVAEYYERTGALGLTPEKVKVAFVAKYGSKPEETTEDFLEERLTELRAKNILTVPTPTAIPSRATRRVTNEVKQPSVEEQLKVELDKSTASQVEVQSVSEPK